MKSVCYQTELSTHYTLTRRSRPRQTQKRTEVGIKRKSFLCVCWLIFNQNRKCLKLIQHATASLSLLMGHDFFFVSFYISKDISTLNQSRNSTNLCIKIYFHFRREDQSLHNTSPLRNSGNGR